MKNFQQFCVVITLSTYVASATSSSPVPITGNSIQWVDIEPSVTIGLGVEPTGFEGHFLYLCRSLNQGKYVVGKLQTHSQNRLVCECPDKTNGTVVSFKFQVLIAPPGTTSWVPSTGQNLPMHAIPGGNFPTGEVSAICRAFYGSGNSIITGAYSQVDGKCYFTASGKYLSQDTFEILVVNGLGISRKVQVL